MRKQQSLHKLFDTLHNHKIVNKSRQLVDSFDALRKRSAHVSLLIERCKWKSATITSRAVLSALRDYRRRQISKRNKLARAERFNRMRLRTYTKLLLSRMRTVLRFEARWIKEVRYQFAYSAREEAFKALSLNVKFAKADRLVIYNRYQALLQ